PPDAAPAHKREVPLAAVRQAVAIVVEVAAQTVTGDVQAALDRADGRLELAAHLLERAAANVERHQRGPVGLLEPLEPGPELRLLLVADQVVARCDAGRLDVVQ